MKSKNGGCVYVITNVVTKNQYVGSTFDRMSNRKVKHLYDLRHGRCTSKLMQEDYIKHGENSFVFYQLEKDIFGTVSDLRDKEQDWLNRLSPRYNTALDIRNGFSENARSPQAKEKVRQKNLGRIQSQEEKEKRSNSRREYYRTHEVHLSDEKKQHLSEINMGENNPNFGLKRSDETRNSISKSNSKVQYTFINPEGYECVFTNLSKWCEIENTNYWAMRQLYRGKLKEWKGWTFVSATKLP